MPVNVIKSPEDEIAWEHAKAAAREEYPYAGGPQLHRIVMAIFKKMTHRDGLARRRRRTQNEPAI
jgi:hypothetical protein